MKLKVTVRTNKVNSQSEREFDIPDAEFEELYDDEKAELIEEAAKEQMFELIEWSFEEIK